MGDGGCLVGCFVQLGRAKPKKKLHRAGLSTQGTSWWSCKTGRTWTTPRKLGTLKACIGARVDQSCKWLAGSESPSGRPWAARTQSHHRQATKKKENMFEAKLVARHGSPQKALNGF